MHWFDELARDVTASLAASSPIVCNAGLSVSGLQHVGRLRGEIVLNHFLATHLRSRGREVTQHLVLYTQDPWKGTEGQRAQFPEGEAERYVGRPLIDVPDPKGCHDHWVAHFWEPFGSTLDRFAPEVTVTRTSDLYQREEMQRWVRDLIGRAEEVREVVNRYRPRNPYPPGWIPFDPFCPVCGRIGAGRTLGLEDGEVAYACECGEGGSSPLERGKLNWRLEWPVLWAVLKVDVEPFGKDHAAPGGSRESCQVIAEEILGIPAPYGIAYEWVGLASAGKDRGDMESSGFLGFDPPTWLEVAAPEILRFLIAVTPIKRRLVLDLGHVDTYHDRYDLAEQAYYEESAPEQARSYELAQLTSPPSSPPFQLGYRHATLLAQVAPSEDRLEWSLQRLRSSGLVSGPLSAMEERRIQERLDRAFAWVRRDGPGNLQVTILTELPQAVRKAFSPEERTSFALLAEGLEAISWTEEAIKAAMVTLTSGKALPLSTQAFFAALYTAFLGRASGPRAAPLLSVLDRQFVLRRLREASA